MAFIVGASTGTVVAGGNGPGTGSTQLYAPFGIYLDLSTNSLIIANRAANNIVRWVIGASSWTLIAGDSAGSSGTSATLLNNPCSVTLDSTGNIFVADTFNHRIQLFMNSQPNGTTIAGVVGSAGSSASLLNTPYALKIDAQRNLYVADTFNQRVQKFRFY